jgi:hypothetical protein
MRFNQTILIWALISSSQAWSAGLPSRKPGLWEVRTAIQNSINPPQVVQQCIDAATDQMLQSSAGPYSAAACPKRDVQSTPNSITIDSACTIGGKAATAHAVITGSFDSAYTMTVTSQTADLAGSKMIMTIDGNWLGPCNADQKPGDIIFSNGRTINILEMLKRSASPTDQLLPR